jgi:hypothetical protein
MTVPEVEEALQKPGGPVTAVSPLRLITRSTALSAYSIERQPIVSMAGTPLFVGFHFSEGKLFCVALYSSPAPAETMKRFATVMDALYVNHGAPDETGKTGDAPVAAWNRRGSRIVLKVSPGASFQLRYENPARANPTWFVDDLEPKVHEVKRARANGFGASA